MGAKKIFTENLGDLSYGWLPLHLLLPYGMIVNSNMAAVDTNASERGPGLQRGRQLDAVHILTSYIVPPQNVVSNIMCTFLCTS